MCKWKTTLHLFVLIILVAIPGNIFAARCSRYPSNTYSPRSPVDENFVIWITGNPQTYILGQSYNISLQAYNGRRFIGASIVLENDNGDIAYNNDLGRLEVTDLVETRFSVDCINIIETTNTNPKTRLDMAWVAPLEPGFGCVLIRATVLQHRDVWFMDDGQLTKRICEESVDDMESQKKDDEEKQCCACDEARYEITFESAWSRNTHPKDFPTKGWLTRFSDILGAAHTSDYRFWDSGALASLAMKEFAEHASSRGLERELNQAFKERKVRTILKARGPSFPYMNTPTVASIRVDPARHQLSLTSKIVPSPDWIVGVSGLELCLPNCTWIEEKVISLYPWDIGTDAGPSYTSADQPQVPPDVIRRIRSDSPSDPRSPFYDENGFPMKPMASLNVKRLRLYERKCEDEESNNSEDIPRECYTHPWSEWSECSVSCGPGVRYRTRFYKQPQVANIYNCDEMVTRRQAGPCQGNCAKTTEESWAVESQETNDSLLQSLQPFIKPESGKTSYECRLGQWSQWSKCNATCGSGYRTRRRLLLDRNAVLERQCQDDMFEYEKCFVSNASCRISNPSSVIGDTGDNNENFGYDRNYGIDQGDQLEDNVMSPQFNAYNGLGRDEEQYVRYGADVTDPDDFQPQIRNNESQMSHYMPVENLRQEPSYPEYIAPESRYGKRTGNFQYLRGPGHDVAPPKPAYQKSFASGFDKIQGYQGFEENMLQRAPSHCYQPLTMVQCSDARVVGNFWFYNFCSDECMLYASDICDRNSNRFPSLEQCEQHCATPMRSSPAFLRLKQKQSPRCQRERRNSSNRKWRGYIV